MKHAPRGLLENIAALGAVQVCNYLIPLVSAAYTARALGVDAWGRVALVQVTLAYFAVLSNWGFQWTATRKIAATSADRAAISDIASATWGAQLLLSLAGAGILLLLIRWVPQFRDDASLYLWGAPLLVLTACFPSWLFNGLERMAALACIEIVSKVLALGVIVATVHDPQDAWLVLAATGFGSVVAAFLGVLWIRGPAGLALRMPATGAMLAELREGAGVFVSTLSISAYVNLIPLVLGAVSGPSTAGLYVLADRIRQAAQSALAPVSNAAFPRMSRLVGNDSGSVRRLLRFSGMTIVGASLLISVALFAGADHAVALLGGHAFAGAAPILRVMAWLPFAMSFSNFLGLQVLLPTRSLRAFNGILVAAGVASLVLVYPFTRAWAEFGAAYVLCIAETFVSLAMIAYVVRSGLVKTLLQRPAG